MNIPAAIFTGLLLLGWTGGGTYVYVCKYRCLCDNTSDTLKKESIAQKDTAKIEVKPQIQAEIKPEIKPDAALRQDGKATIEGKTDALSKEEKNIIDDKIIVYFQTASINMIETADNQLYFVALQKYLATNPNAIVSLTGHTDNTGVADQNLVYGKNRAENVKNILISRGIKATQIETETKGQTEPLADNSTDDGKGKNRRCEVVVKK
jgi:outer membrane protein OmpA-like peptidoglycan-associated protein